MGRREIPQLAASDRGGRIYGIPHLEGTGMKGGCFFRFSREDLIRLPANSELFVLPDRSPVGFDRNKMAFTALDNLSSVAAFISPGYTVTHNASFLEKKKGSMLPLFSYAAVVIYKNDFYVSAVCVDRERRQDQRFMDMRLLRKNVRRMKKRFPKNRLIGHLSGCALTYGCPAAKNFFLVRYEAPLPTSPYCNAACIGCISYQPKNRCSVTQPRIKFIPTPEEVAETALYHIQHVPDPVVSFGQGCEGEPLLVDKVLERSIGLIRRETGKGIINLNTNASSPKKIARLFDAGLDSIRVSMNSAREEYYRRYYKPRGYGFKDVLASIKTAKRMGGFVSVNYLSSPGFSDSEEEYDSFKELIAKLKVDMVQWRNLNYDPIEYMREMRFECDGAGLLGLRKVISSLKRENPSLMMGYFNPSKGRIRRNKLKEMPSRLVN